MTGSADASEHPKGGGRNEKKFKKPDLSPKHPRPQEVDRRESAPVLSSHRLDTESLLQLYVFVFFCGILVFVARTGPF